VTTDRQVIRLRKHMSKENKISKAADRAGMDEKTARKYLASVRLPSQMKKDRNWRTRPDPFADDWEGLRQMLEINPGLQAKTLFEFLQNTKPGRYRKGQRRSLERKIRRWRALEGPPKEVFFEQEHKPGELSASDFTDMSGLGITIRGQAFPHLLYHFVLTHSNWEAGTVCFSESFESLSAGLQNAFWKLGGVTAKHRTDRMSAAVNNLRNPEEFTERYRALLNHLGIRGEKTQARRPNENGDVEQSHNRLKTAVDQSLMLRGSRDFDSREEYESFLQGVIDQLNSCRAERLKEERKALRRLPKMRLDDFKEMDVRVTKFCTIRVLKNMYSLDSRLIGEWVKIRVHAEKIEVRFAGRPIEILPRLRGQNKHRINYRHIIHSLVKKPGAFANYRYQDDMFPTNRFRAAYDMLREAAPGGASKEYLKILHLAAYESESGVDDALRLLMEEERPVSFAAVEGIVKAKRDIRLETDVRIEDVDLDEYDELLEKVACEEAA